MITSFAKTQGGARRMVQYEVSNGNFSAPPLPGALTLVGPLQNNSYGTPHSDNFGVVGTDAHSGPKGTCSPPQQDKDSIIVSTTNDVATLIPQIFRPANYTGASGTTPDVGTLAANTADAAHWQDPVFLNALVTELRGYATSQSTYFNTFSGCSLGKYKNGQNICGSPASYGSTNAPQVTFVDGDVNAATGAGLLVVTGNLTFNGDFSWDGEILVIGTGSFSAKGGGNGAVTGGVFVAHTADKNSQGTGMVASTTLGTPTFDWSGGGGNGVTWDSCWASSVDTNNSHAFTIISFRELSM
jgi:hypothetical protein